AGCDRALEGAWAGEILHGRQVGGGGGTDDLLPAAIPLIGERFGSLPGFGTAKQRFGRTSNSRVSLGPRNPAAWCAGGRNGRCRRRHVGGVGRLAGTAECVFGGGLTLDRLAFIGGSGGVGGGFGAGYGSSVSQP